MKKAMALLFTFLFCIVFLTNCERENVKIGFSGCLTGTNSELGVSGMYGALLAVEDINQAGGVKGQNLELIALDDEGNKENALKVDMELYQDGCIAIIGHMISEMAELTVPYINENRILMISPTIAKATLSDIDDYFFRLIPPNTSQAERIAGEIKKRNIKSVQILYSDQNVSFANCINNSLIEDLEENNIKTELLGAISIDKNNDLLKAQVDMILHSDADALVIVASADIVSEIAQSLYQDHCEKTVFLPAWAMTNDLIKRGGPSVEGFYGVNFVDLDSRSSEYISFKKKYEQKYGEEPTFASILSYESISVLASAMEESERYDGDHLKSSILKIQEFKGLQSKLKINRFGDIERGIFLYQIRDGKFVKVE